jgi:predicted AAA+ superfamily ATPase
LLEIKAGEALAGSWICIDEIQKLPFLLDEVHRLIEKKRWKFALSASSARKLKRSGANLLAGRAVIKKMLPFSAFELKKKFDLEFVLRFGSLPLVFDDKESAAETLSAYVQTYLQEEIRSEALVRVLQSFHRFLQVAGMMHGQFLNKSNIAREAMVKASTVNEWFAILEDTLIGFMLPAWQPALKVQEVKHPKFYFFDYGVARAASGRIFQSMNELDIGFSFETFLINEIKCYLDFAKKHFELFTYRTADGLEIDLIIELEKKTFSTKPSIVAIEIKAGKKMHRSWQKPLKNLLEKTDKIKVPMTYVVYLGTERYTYDFIQILPVTDFLDRLYAHKIL